MSEGIPEADKKDTTLSSNTRNKVNPMQEDGILDSSEQKEGTLLNQSGEQLQKPLPEPKTLGKLRQLCAYPPQGIIAEVITIVAIAVLCWALTWVLTGKESLPGGSIFGIVFLYFASVIGGKIMQLIKIPGLPPLPRLLGMLLAGFSVRNIAFINRLVIIKEEWGATFRNIALSIILALAGLGLDPKALNKLKAVCFRLSFGPCIIEACAAAVISHFLMHFPWEWGFMLGFVLGAVSPAIVVLSMLNLQQRGFGVDHGIPSLLIAAASMDDIVAITGFNTFLGMAFSTGSTLQGLLHGLLEIAVGTSAGCLLGLFICYFPSKDQEGVVWKRTFFVVGLSTFSLLSSKYSGLPGSGGLCIIVLAFLGGIAWSDEKKAVEEMVKFAWNLFQPFLFGLIGAEISITSLKLDTVGLCFATLILALTVRITATFILVTFSGFDFKEKLFIALAWIPKATVQAAIGSVALDTARGYQNDKLEKYGLYILTIAFLGILFTAPTGALLIGLVGPKLLHKTEKDNDEDSPRKANASPI